MNRVIDKKLLAALLCVAICLLIFYACKKVEAPSEQKRPVGITDSFFLRKPGTDTLVSTIAKSIKRQDDQRHFVSKLVANAGFALWDKARVVNGPDGPQAFIPFAKKGEKRTKAILIVRVKGADTLYHLLYGAHASHYGFDDTNKKGWNAKDIFHAFITFDNEIFGTKEFVVTDKRMFNDPKGRCIVKLRDKVLPLAQAQQRVETVWEITVTTTYIVCHTCVQNRETAVNSMSDCCNAQYFEVPVTYYFDDATEDEDWGWYTPSGYEGGSGGPCPGCNWADTNPCDVIPPYENFCDEFWTPTQTAPAYNPADYDSVNVTPGLALKYPCAAAFIKDSLTNANFLAQLAGANVFKDSAYINLNFDTSRIYTTSSDPYSATTSNDFTPYVNGDGITVFSGTIKLNPWYLKHGTKEYMVATILHEVMHAVFNMRWAQYTSWLQFHDTQYDSNYMKAKFPMYWYAIQNQTSPLTAAQDHEIMAADYLNTFSDILREFYNPNASTAIRDTVIKAMAYDGLRKTTAWKALPSQGVDTCKYRSIQLSSEKSLTGTTEYPTGCTSTTPFHYSNDLKLRPSCN